MKWFMIAPLLLTFVGGCSRDVAGEIGLEAYYQGDLNEDDLKDSVDITEPGETYVEIWFFEESGEQCARVRFDGEIRVQIAPGWSETFFGPERHEVCGISIVGDTIHKVATKIDGVTIKAEGVFLDQRTKIKLDVKKLGTVVVYLGAEESDTGQDSGT